MVASATALLELRGICKRFGATRALDDVDLCVAPGEVHALIGENGAGKSTLMKILSGACRADAGRMRLRGRPLVIHSPLEGRRRGIAMVYQELNLAPHLTVEANLTLGMERHTCGILRSRASEVREALALLAHTEIPLNVPVATLSIGLQQIVEIARGLIGQADVIIMDEPTSSLSATDTRALFEVLKRLKASGRAVIYISHFLEEVFEIGERYTVLRDGRCVDSGRLAETDMGRIIHRMVGRELNEMFPRVPHGIGEPVLRVSRMRGEESPRDTSFVLRRGEILGIAGLVGSGRSEMARRIFGLDRATAGTLRRGEEAARDLSGMTPRRALETGMDFLSENRKDEGLAAGMGVAGNITLSSLGRFTTLRRLGLLSLSRERKRATHWIERLRIRCRGPEQRVMTLSGGNQQKVALARILQQDGELILLDEPTRGIDVRSKVEIYQWIGELAKAGKGVMFISSYLPELLGVCDTLGVMHRGRLSRVRPVSEWDASSVMRMATSGAGMRENEGHGKRRRGARS